MKLNREKGWSLPHVVVSHQSTLALYSDPLISEINQHTAKVACQSCHIPIYGKNASDSIATEATELQRSWQAGTEHTHAPFHPVLVKANNQVPVYRYWNRMSDNYLLFDQVYEDPETG